MAIEESLSELENSEIWRDVVMKNYSLSPEQFFTLFEAFKAKCLVSGENKTPGGLKIYFSNWLPLNINRILPKFQEKSYESYRQDKIKRLLNGE